MKTRNFLALVTLIIGVLMVVSAVLAPVGNVDGQDVNLGAYNVSRLPAFLFVFLVRFATWLVIGLILAATMMVILRVYSFSQLRLEMQKRDNASHAILAMAMYAASAVLAASVSFTFFWAYISNIIFRGGIAVLCSTYGTAFVARLFGVRSMAEFEEWVENPGNNDYAIIVGGLFVCVMILVALGR